MAPRVERYMSTPVISVYPHDTVARARNLMLRHRIGRLVVIDPSEKPIGIISRTDMINYFLNKRKNYRSLDEVRVEEVMNKPLITISATASIKRASEIMLKHNISSLPVISGEERTLIGIITSTDLIRAFRDLGSGLAKVSEYMRRDPNTVLRSHSIFYIIDLINRDPDRKIIVIENQKPIGIITESDIVFIEPATLTSRDSYFKRRGYSGRGFMSVVRDYIIPLAEDIMTPNPLTVTGDEDLSVAADVMYKNRISSLPVVDSSGSLIGLVSKKSMLRAIIDLL
ncbi:MAG: CBS domain-containing protein [Sulfolobales archaeon]